MKRRLTKFTLKKTDKAPSSNLDKTNLDSLKRLTVKSVKHSDNISLNSIQSKSIQSKSKQSIQRIQCPPEISSEIITEIMKQDDVELQELSKGKGYSDRQETQSLTAAELSPPAADHEDLLQRALESRDTFGKYLFAVAGITVQDIHAVVEELRRALTATDTKFFSHQGAVTGKRNVIAWQSRLAAIEKWIRLLDLYGAKSDKPGSRADRVLKVEVDLAPGLKRLRGVTERSGT